MSNLEIKINTGNGIENYDPEKHGDLILKIRPEFTIYTDGACKGNPGPGGWAAYSTDGVIDISGHNSSTTNNEMELTAVLRALDAVTENAKVTVKTDSKFAIGCCSWGWKSKSNPKNTRLIKLIFDTIRSKNLMVYWEHVEGHGADQLNRYVDSVASRRRKG